MSKINDLPLLSNPTADMYCLVGKGDLQKVPWSAIMGQIGSPYIATTVAGMTDKTRVYVYQGSESGYTSGNWYYWNGSAWTSGGTYNSAAVDTDKTLTQSDKPADSAVVGKEIGSLKESLNDKANDIKSDFNNEISIINSDLAREIKNRENEDKAIQDKIDNINNGGLNLKDEVIQENIQKWLDNHPEATTSVQDGCITEKKIYPAFLEYLKKDYVTPEMFGAVGDGVIDDTDAIKKAIDTNKIVVMKSNYLFSRISLKNNTYSFGTLNGTIEIATSFIDFNFNRLNGTLELNASENIVQACKIYGKRLNNTEGKGLVLCSKKSGVQYCTISIALIYAKKCIVYDTSLGGWVNNNYVINTNVAYGTGIITEPSSGTYEGAVFDKVGFEDIEKWFELNNCTAFIFRDFRMMPWESNHRDTISGDIKKSRNIIFSESITGVYFEYINFDESSSATGYNVMSRDGEIVANKALITANGLIATEQTKKRCYIKLSEQTGSNFIIDYQYDINKPIIIDADADKYLWINLVCKLTRKSVKYLTFIIKGTLQNNIEVAIDNILKITITPNSGNEHKLWIDD